MFKIQGDKTQKTGEARAGDVVQSASSVRLLDFFAARGGLGDRHLSRLSATGQGPGRVICADPCTIPRSPPTELTPSSTDRFVIHGRLITSWSMAAVIGPLLINKLYASRVADGMPRAEAYNGTFYLMCGLLALGLLANLLVRPVNAKHHLK